MSKNLGHIPKQSAMEEAVEQAFTNGINRGRKLERESIIKMLEDPITMNRWWGQPDKNLGLYGNLVKYVIARIEGKDV